MKALVTLLCIILGGLLGVITGLKILEYVAPEALQRLLQAVPH